MPLQPRQPAQGRRRGPGDPRSTCGPGSRPRSRHPSDRRRRPPRSLADPGQALRPGRLALLLDPDSFVEDGRYANALAPGPAGGRRGDRPRHGRRPSRRGDRQRPHREGRVVGCPHRGEDRRATETALREELAGLLARRQRGARITDQVEMFQAGAGRVASSTTRCALRQGPQICCLFGPSAAGGAYIPSFLRRHHHGRGQRLDVPRRPADGRDGRGGEGVARGDGRGEDALHRLGRGGTCWRTTTPRRSSWRGSTSVPADQLALAAADLPPGGPTGR